MSAASPSAWRERGTPPTSRFNSGERYALVMMSGCPSRRCTDSSRAARRLRLGRCAGKGWFDSPCWFAVSEWINCASEKLGDNLGENRVMMEV